MGPGKLGPIISMESPLGLKEKDGYRVTLAAPEIDHSKHVEVNGHVYVTAHDLVGKAAGRLLDWKLLENLESARARDWPFIKINQFKNGAVVICGSGPSIGKMENLRRIRQLQKRGAKVHAINRCHDFLCSKGIIPDSASLLDPIPHVAGYIKPRKGVDYFIGFQCHPDTFDVFETSNIDHFIWYCRTSKILDAQLTPRELAYAVPSRTSTNGLRSIMLNYMRGMRTFHLFGFDSSYETELDASGVEQIKLSDDGKGRLHAHAKPETIHDVKTTKVLEQDSSGERAIYQKDYFTNSAMLSQADEFTSLIDDIRDGVRGGFMDDVFFYVHGDGLIPDIASSGRYPFHFDRTRIRKNV